MIDPTQMQAGGPPGPPAALAPQGGDPNAPNQPPDPNIPVGGPPTDPQSVAQGLSQQFVQRLMAFRQAADEEAQQKVMAAAQLALQDMHDMLAQVMDQGAMGAQTLDGGGALQDAAY